MDAEEIRKLKPKLRRYLDRFHDCFFRRDTREHFCTYVEGQLSDLREKSCEPIALAAGVPPRDLQEFLGAYKWNEDLTRNRLQEMVVHEDAGPNAVGIIDETSDVKHGDKTPGVQRQWCGTRGKTENCIVTVHLAYATGDFHCLVDGEPGGDQVLSQQCCGGDPGPDLVAGGLLALAGGTMFRGPETRGGAGSVGRPSLVGIETALDPHLGELPVPGSGTQRTAGGKIQN